MKKVWKEIQNFTLSVAGRNLSQCTFLERRKRKPLERPAVRHRTHNLFVFISALSASNQAKAIMYHYLIFLVLRFLEVFTVFTVKPYTTADIKYVQDWVLFGLLDLLYLHSEKIWESGGSSCQIMQRYGAKCINNLLIRLSPNCVHDSHLKTLKLWFCSSNKKAVAGYNFSVSEGNGEHFGGTSCVSLSRPKSQLGIFLFYKADRKT